MKEKQFLDRMKKYIVKGLIDLEEAGNDAGFVFNPKKETPMKINLLVCNCGDCTHWELATNSIICKTCGKEFKVRGLKDFVNHNLEPAAASSIFWKEHER
jgi:hypothetical protein